MVHVDAIRYASIPLDIAHRESKVSDASSACMLSIPGNAASSNCRNVVIRAADAAAQACVIDA